MLAICVLSLRNILLIHVYIISQLTMPEFCLAIVRHSVKKASIMAVVNHSLCCLFQVESVDAGSGVEVRFMRKAGNHYVWPTVHDSSFVFFDELLGISPVPHIEGRDRHFFKNNS